MEIQVNYLAVLITAVISYVSGALWYSPLLFGKMWMKDMGYKMEDMEKHKEGIWKSYLAAFVSAFVMFYVLAHFVEIGGAEDFAGGAQTGFWAWLGFSATVLLGGVLWEGKTIRLYMIAVAHYLVALVVGGGILAVM